MKRFAIVCILALAPILVQAQTLQGSLSAQGTSCSLTTTTGSFDFSLPSNMGSVTVQVTGTFAATLQFMVSNDGLNYVNRDGLPIPSGAAVSTTTAAGMWQLSTAGVNHFCVRASAYTSGVAFVSLTYSPIPISVATANVSGTITANQGTANATPWNDNIAQVNGHTFVEGGSNGSTGVGGLAASGAAPAGNPVYVAGKDAAGNVSVPGYKSAVPLMLPTGAGQDGWSNSSVSYFYDQAGNPVIPMIANMVWSNANWERLRDVIIGNNVAGTGIPADGTYGNYNTPQSNSSAPLANITNGNYANLQTDQQGRLIVTPGITQMTWQASQTSGITNATTTRNTFTGLGQYQNCSVLINITNGGAATGTLQIYVQDSVDGGTTWDDLISSNTFTFGAAVTTQRFFITDNVTPQTVTAAVATNITEGSAVSVEAMAAGTVRNSPWGDRVRIREKVSGVSGSPTGVTYTINAACKGL